MINCLERLILATKGVQDLKKDVLDNGLCTACGACVNLCPYIDLVAGRAVIIEFCGLKEGKCYAFCPRTYVDVELLDKQIFGLPREDPALGCNRLVLKARAKDPEIRFHAQYGGVVSALVSHAIESGSVDVAILAKSRDGVSPEPTIARNRKEVLESARSKYLVCPTVSKVFEAIKQESGNICFVGTPCQVTAIRKMQMSTLQPEANRIKLIIGLFCTWALSPHAYTFIQEKIRGSKVLKVDVPPPPANLFVIQTEKEKIEIPLEDLRKFIMPSCNVCFDMTNEFADISVGAVEGEEDWNTVIVRTAKGEKIFREAINMGILETSPLEQERFDHLREAALTRKKRVLTQMENSNVCYLILSEEEKSKITSWKR